jgi:hypothetical protein
MRLPKRGRGIANRQTGSSTLFFFFFFCGVVVF